MTLQKYITAAKAMQSAPQGTEQWVTAANVFRDMPAMQIAALMIEADGVIAQLRVQKAGLSGAGQAQSDQIAKLTAELAELRKPAAVDHKKIADRAESLWAKFCDNTDELYNDIHQAQEDVLALISLFKAVPPEQDAEVEHIRKVLFQTEGITGTCNKPLKHLLSAYDQSQQDLARTHNAWQVAMVERDAAKEQLRAYPADWRKDSSLETWFPVTSTMLTMLQAERDAARSDALVRQGQLEQSRAQLDAAREAERRLREALEYIAGTAVDLMDVHHGLCVSRARSELKEPDAKTINLKTITVNLSDGRQTRGALHDGDYWWMFIRPDGYRTPLRLTPESMHSMIKIYAMLLRKQVDDESRAALAQPQPLNYDPKSGTVSVDIAEHLQTPAGQAQLDQVTALRGAPPAEESK